MNGNGVLAVVGVLLLGAALGLRRANAATVDTSTPSLDLVDILGGWGEPDQAPSILESAWISMDPSTYYGTSLDANSQAANEAAFLRMIRFAEGTAGSNGYRTLFGGGLFDSFADHPRIYVPFRNTSSSAAGAYQILARTWDGVRAKLGLPDFSPASQDLAALELIRERGALNDVRAGRTPQAIAKVAKVWASMPGAGYDQPEKQLSALLSVYFDAGGQLEQA